MVNDWPALLKRASVQALSRPALAYKTKRLSLEQKDRQWLASGPPVSQGEILQFEARLGVEIPISLREFFETSNGFVYVNHLIDRIRSVEELSWENRDPELAWLADSLREQGNVTDIDDGKLVDCAANAARILRALQVTDFSGNSSVILLDPAAGALEWPALILSPEGMIQEFESFFHAVQYEVDRTYSLYG
ncbi:hypothetical protein F183_A03580 [Bryobacterales bacterium F-183]|nr:hypothetical protein F183_A03580 [Bryobacterales bacterium F-183]